MYEELNMTNLDSYKFTVTLPLLSMNVEFDWILLMKCK